MAGTGTPERTGKSSGLGAGKGYIDSLRLAEEVLLRTYHYL